MFTLADECCSRSLVGVTLLGEPTRLASYGNADGFIMCTRRTQNTAIVGVLGVSVHEQTSWSSFPSVFKFLRERLAAVEKGKESTTDTDGADEGSPGAATPAGGRGGKGTDHSMSDEDGEADDDGSNTKKMKMTK
ncbi:hypothetical protein Pcinc_030654 [Petrolisthes cinctipes]|uniref:Uncharacterized protein n=1 Tax=Petrolisthes cinctipes TaxID=88211 RepID=A0AAE1EXX8_PETCI|nr:hypothetical protein Pcinc_030654 [Petrolisthes cinctipes]